LDILKEKMVTAPISLFLEWKNELHVHVDASYIMIGVMLTQASEEYIHHPIEFVSRNLSKAGKNY